MHCRERWNDPVEENRNEEVLQDADETTAAQEQEPEITDEAVKEETAQAADADTAEEAADASEASETDEAPKKGFFKKKKDKKDTQIEELTDRVQRQMAEFDNFRKRSEKEKAAMFEVGARSVVEKILPTVDNFERGLASVSEEQKEEPFVQGMEKVYRQLIASLEAIGVKQIEAVGQEFDPNFHNAVMHVDDEEAGDNIIVEEFQKGYMYRDTVVRHSMVKVAN